MNRKILISSLFILLVLAGCSSAPKDNEESTPKEPEVNESTDNEEKNNDEIKDDTSYKNNIKYAANQIYDLFLEDYDGVKVTQIELSAKNESYIYEVEGYDESFEHESKYDAKTSEMTSYEKDDLDDHYNDLSKDGFENIEGLIDMSLDDAGEGYFFEEYSIKAKDGFTKIEIEVKNESDHDIEYEYDLNTKELIEKDD